ncbi:MAG: aldose epimerase [Actinomycetales bacterium]|nr:aldose epimerase [Actinomycetales bacterium]
MGANAASAARPGELVLVSEGWRLGVLPGLGGCWSFGQIRVGDQWVDLLRPTPDASLGNPEDAASFPLLPWSNRIRDGVLEWDGRTHQLVRNGADGTAIHGAVRQLPWQVALRDTCSVVLQLSTCDVVGVNWPWEFSARQVISLVGSTLEVRLSVTNEDSVAFPVGLGHHPYFQRVLGSEDAVLHVDASAGYALEAGMASAAAGEVPARADYRAPRPLGADFVDDVLTGLGPTAARWQYPDVGVEVSLAADPEFSHLVVYEPVGRDHFAVEPVTHVNDGIALHARGVEGTGVRVLPPGETYAATFTLTFRPTSSSR